jgi:hypothetical protein
MPQARPSGNLGAGALSSNQVLQNKFRSLNPDCGQVAIEVSGKKKVDPAFQFETLS